MEILNNLAERVISGEKLTKEEGLQILSIPDELVMDLVEEASKVRKYFFKNQMEFCSLINAKNGACTEDCSFCAQSSHYKTPINAYGLVSKDEMLAGAEKAVAINANRYCIVVSGRKASKEEVDKIADAIKEIKKTYPIKVCCSLGTVDEKDLDKLKVAGVDRINHNLETSEKYFSKIVSTHTWKERYKTIKKIQKVGLSTCTGGIFGMGESDEDIIDLAMTYRDLEVDSIPLNFLIPIPGTPLGDKHNLTPLRCLKIIALFRLFNPKSEIRLCGGRELNLKDYHDIAFEVANCLMAGGYLTRAGREPGKDEEMARRLGRELIKNGASFSVSNE
ncbi:MAG TPA: biotin synthase [Sulfurihydrogenibium sp.]|uniref:Biotin synthase n=1 Tax=Sulfurihydrogenibium sp. (strain YO3AOP1) TaxID=436114 RepID=BIOB_SULSY|nr:biotin synthase BioB [Sulfurihydrogenibium sp. YO3AOP1]B2V8G9.1 RecName: Full=Biotin synthase [Sulfurihydrogenibium sp. YO3AOP1]ACD66242.1 biotin synthase [Sulfurihydrogenibium sp. YO3AOP1]HBT97938.1 biotin synthase [Sulfurihydrogenibium sp.]